MFGDIFIGILLVIVGAALLAAHFKAVIDNEVDKHLKK